MYVKCVCLKSRANIVYNLSWYCHYICAEFRENWFDRLDVIFTQINIIISIIYNFKNLNRSSVLEMSVNLTSNLDYENLVSSQILDFQFWISEDSDIPQRMKLWILLLLVNIKLSDFTIWGTVEERKKFSSYSIILKIIILLKSNIVYFPLSQRSY